MSYIRLGPADALPPGEAVAVDFEGRSIGLFNVGGQFFAVGDECLHMGAPLSQGDVRGTTVSCPWHGWCYDLATGERLGRQGSALPTYPVTVRDGWIVLEEGNDDA